MIAPFWLVPAFGLVAALYATAGLGGATAYAALLSLTPIPYTQIPPLVLTLNLLVAGGAYWNLRRAGRVPRGVLPPLLATSIPAAFVGGLIPLQERTFLLLLALAIFTSGVRFLLGPLLHRGRSNSATAGMTRGLLAPLGLGIGLLSGMTGIGGGVYLGPILLLTGRSDIGTVPALTSGFVFFNSAAGLASQLTRIRPAFDLWIPLGAAVTVGALAGVFVSLRGLPTRAVQRVFGAVLISVALLNGARAL